MRDKGLDCTFCLNILRNKIERDYELGRINIESITSRTCVGYPLANKASGTFGRFHDDLAVVIPKNVG